jgi:hypothetical protein
MIATKDEDNNIYIPKGNLSEFYENLKNKLPCKMNFVDGDKTIIISYPEHYYSLSSRDNVKFTIDKVNILISYDLCFEAICDFLKQFQFVM